MTYSKEELNYLPAYWQTAFMARWGASQLD